MQSMPTDFKNVDGKLDFWYSVKQLRQLGKNGNKKAYGYWNLLDLYD